MSDLYASANMASGYAQWRPPVHERVIQRVRDHLQLRAKVARVLDIGCGAGLSTAALEPIADVRVGVEPAEPMLKYATLVAPRAITVVGRAEELPFANQSFQLMTAAGSLNYVDVGRFFEEARRVLAHGGHLVVYDFGPGRSFRGSGALEDWYAEFEKRYPFPAATRIDPETFKADHHAIRREGHELFETAIAMKPDFYLEYALTETSVAAAVERGVRYAEIRDWCAATLPAVFGGPLREVVFRGYILYMRAV